MVRDLIPWRKKRTRQGDLPVGRREPDPFLALRREIDDVFEDFLSGFGGAGGWLPGPWSGASRERVVPRVDVSETDAEVRVTAELPGLDEKDLHVTLEDDALIISGETRREEETKNRDYRMVERSVGSFSRAIALPPGLETDGVKARFKKGVLTVVFPRSAEARAARRSIEIEAG